MKMPCAKDLLLRFSAAIVLLFSSAVAFRIDAQTAQTEPQPNAANGIATFAKAAAGIKRTIALTDALGTLTSKAVNPAFTAATLPLATLGSYYEIVGERQQESDRKFRDAAKAIDRDLKAAGVNLSVDDCFANPARCRDISGLLSAETKMKLDDSNRAYSGFVAGFDSNNWSESEKKKFLADMGPEIAMQGGDALAKGQKYWEVIKKVDAAHTVADELRSGAGNQEEKVKPTAQDYDAAQAALASQGAHTRSENARPRGERKESDFESDFSRSADAERGRLDAVSRESQQKFDAFSKQLKKDDAVIGRQVVDSASTASPPPVVVSNPGKARVVGTGTVDTTAAKTDHCPNGVFVCPNGNPWPKCGHPEKYQCPPPEYAAEAAKELASQKKKQ